MRAPFNELATFYWGISQATPLAVRVDNVPVRVVRDIAFVDRDVPLDLSRAYLTVDSIIPIGPDVTLTAAGIYAVDYTKADRVGLPAGSPPEYVVGRVELRTWPVGPNYDRLHIFPASDCKNGTCPRYSVDLGGPILSMTAPLTWESGAWSLTLSLPDTWTLIVPGGAFPQFAFGWDGCGDFLFTATGGDTPRTLTCLHA